MTSLRSGQPVTDAAICEQLGMSRQTAWEWRQDADFRSWLRIELDEDQTVALSYAISRHLQLAIEGSERSLFVLAKLKALGVF